MRQDLESHSGDQTISLRIAISSHVDVRMCGSEFPASIPCSMISGRNFVQIAFSDKGFARRCGLASQFPSSPQETLILSRSPPLDSPQILPLFSSFIQIT